MRVASSLENKPEYCFHSPSLFQLRLPNAIYLVNAGSATRKALSKVKLPADVDVVSFPSLAAFLEYDQAKTFSSCLVLNLCRHDDDDFPLQCELASQSAPPVIFICGHGDIASVVRVLKAGASELLIAPVVPTELTDAISKAFLKDRELKLQKAQEEELQQRHASLTPRERDVLPLIVSGLLNKQAASVLGISEVTLQIHRSQVMRKMKAGSVADLVRMATNLHIPESPAHAGPFAEKLF
jgi:FixJ family two-component response regulator